METIVMPANGYILAESLRLSTDDAEREDKYNLITCLLDVSDFVVGQGTLPATILSIMRKHAEEKSLQLFDGDDNPIEADIQKVYIGCYVGEDDLIYGDCILETTKDHHIIGNNIFLISSDHEDMFNSLHKFFNEEEIKELHGFIDENLPDTAMCNTTKNNITLAIFEELMNVKDPKEFEKLADDAVFNPELLKKVLKHENDFNANVLRSGAQHLKGMQYRGTVLSKHLSQCSEEDSKKLSPRAAENWATIHQLLREMGLGVEDTE